MSNMIVYDNVELELKVSVEKETVWLSREQLSELFDRNVKTIGKHINNVFKEKELERKLVVANFATTTQHGEVAEKTQSKNQKVDTTVFSHTISKTLHQDVKKYNSQYKPLSLKTTKNFHDRFLAIDDNEVYHVGASLKDLGKKVFGFSKMRGFDVGMLGLY